MKRLVTQYHALNIKDLARGGWLYPFSSGTLRTGMWMDSLYTHLHRILEAPTNLARPSRELCS
jgi:hypothetical protein